METVNTTTGEITEEDDGLEPDGFVRPFADLLRDHAGGRLHDEITEQLARVVRGVVQTAKPGTVTITLKVEPTGKDNVDQLILSDKIVVKVPEIRRPSIFFPSGTGNLSRDLPDQMVLPPLRSAPPRPSTPPKKA